MAPPCVKRLVLPVSLGLGGSVLRPLLTSVRTARSYPRSPRLSGQPYSRVRAQISPNKSVNCRCTSSPSTVESVGNGFVVHRQLASGSLLAYMAFLYVASQLWRERCRLLHRSRVRRLPSHGRSPFRGWPRRPCMTFLYVALQRWLRLPSHGRSPARSCLHLVLCQSERSFGILTSLRLPVSYTGLSPDKITPMPGVHRVAGRVSPPGPHTTVHAGPHTAVR